MKKIRLPKTSDGYSKKLEEIQNAGIRSIEDEYRYAYIMFNSIEFEMNRLRNMNQTNPLVKGLLERYELLRVKWKTALKRVESQISE